MGSALLLASHSKDDAISLGRHNVRADFIQIENDASDVWGSAMLRGSNLAYAIGVHRHTFRAVVADGVRDIQEDPIRIYRSINLRLNRRTDGDLDP
jgi:hypothetical protein